MSSLIALVDEQDNITGFSDKTEVHQKGLLHRAFSIIIFNSKGEMLLQQRALSKYHSAGLWTNACCSHLTTDTEMDIIIHDRLINEMGFDCHLEQIFKFQYHVNFDNGLTENEIDWVYRGIFEGTPNPNPDEVQSYRWINMVELVKEINHSPEKFTYWFKYIISNHLNHL